MIYVPTCMVWVKDYTVFPDPTQYVRGITINLSEKKATDGSLTLADPDSIFAESGAFQKNSQLAFMLGWAHEVGIFGPYIIKSYAQQFPESGDRTLTVNFQDHSHRMNKQEKQRRHTGKASDVIKGIASEYGLGYDISGLEDLEFSDDFPLTQANLSDAALLQRLADRYGFIWGIEGMNLYFRRPLSAVDTRCQDGVPILSYQCNDWSLKSFSPEIKFLHKGKRKDAVAATDGADLAESATPDEAGESEGESTLGKFAGEASRLIKDKLPPEIAKLLDMGTGQTAGDDVPGQKPPSQEPKNQKPPKKPDGEGTWDVFTTEFTPLKTAPDATVAAEAPKETKATEAGGAPAQDQAETSRRLAAAVLGSSEVITSPFVPTIASVWYLPGKAVILDGVGAKMCGRYQIQEVTLSLDAKTFKVAGKIMKRTFYPSTEDKELLKANQASQAEANEPAQPTPGTPKAAQKGKQAPGEHVIADPYSGYKIVKNVDGVPQ